MVSVFLVLSKESNAYVYYTDCEHRAHIYKQFVLNISHCFDLNEIFSFFLCFRFSQHQRLVCINVYISFLVTRISKVIYCRLSFWQLHLQSLDQTRQKRKGRFWRWKSQNSPPDDSDYKSLSNGKDFLMIRAKLNENGPKTEKHWLFHVKR